MAEHDQPEHRPNEPSARDSPSMDPSSKTSPSQPSSIDPEQLRQFQQFQQFQEFQRFQDTQRQQAAKPPSPRDWRSFLRWLITRRLVRRVLRLAIIIVLVLFAARLAVDYYFGGNSSSSGNRVGASPVLPQNPKETVYYLYDAVGKNVPADACRYFTPDAAKTFARDLGGDDCPAAVHRAASKVQDNTNYAPELRKFPDVSLTGDVTISSCTLPVQGGDRLGKFVLHKQPDGGWIIRDHQNEPCTTG